MASQQFFYDVTKFNVRPIDATRFMPYSNVMAKQTIDAILRQSYRLRKAGITNEMIAIRSTFSRSAVELWRGGKLSKTGRAYPAITAAVAALLAEAELAKVGEDINGN